MEESMTSAYLSLGSNLGDKIENLNAALKELNFKAGEIAKVSAVYETDPVGFYSEDKFLNICAELRTSLRPMKLLEIIHEIEELSGRKRENSREYSSRTLDIDIILFGDLLMENEVLTIPHPRFHERLFVLAPLNDIATNLVIPQFNITVEELLNKLETKEAVKRTEFNLFY
jgi:2-amino-4-hydroxy-6-hydroxymethyldihydropteridine diphosphokinase